MLRVMVCGAGGKMGREVVKAVHADAELVMAGGIDPNQGSSGKSHHYPSKHHG